MSHAIHVTGTLAALVLTGCSLAISYPPEQSEDTAEACTDRADQDLDGLVDCADPDCDGHCPEEDEAACSNGRDDDMDGFVDIADARCWPGFRVLPAARCSSTTSVDTTFTLNASEFTTPPETTEVTVSGGARVPALLVNSTTSLVSSDVLTGAMVGSTVEATIYSSGTPMRMGLVSAASAADPRAFARTGVFVSLTTTGLFVSADDVMALATFPPHAQPFAVRLEIRDGTLAVFVAGVEATLVPPSAGAPTLQEGLARFRPDEPMQFLIEGAGEGVGPAVVGRISAHRDAYEPCHYPVPQFTQPLLGLGRLADDTLCALVGQGVGAAITSADGCRSTDEGAHWFCRPTGLTAPTDQTLGVASIASLDATTLGAAVVVLRGGSSRTRVADVLLTTTTDCRTWTTTSSGIGLMLPGAVAERDVGLVVNGDATDVLLRWPMQHAVLRFRSPHGLEGPFELMGSEDIPPDAPFLDRVALGLHWLRAGGDELVLASSARGAELYVPSSTGWRSLVAPLAAPTNVDGNFDARVVEAIGVTITMQNGLPHFVLGYDSGALSTCTTCFPAAVTSASLGEPVR